MPKQHNSNLNPAKESSLNVEKSSQSTTTLYLLCGKMASGKSTLARNLALKTGGVLLSEDEFLAALYPGEIDDISTYVRYSNRVKSAIRPMLVDLLSKNTSLVLDFPANTGKQRAWLLKLAAEARVTHELHYLDVSNCVCKKRLLQRASEEPERSATDTEVVFDTITVYFEPPEADEGLNIIQANLDA